MGQSAGIGFAVPVDTVEQVARELIEQGHVARAYLGVSTVALTPDLAHALGLPVQAGALILDVAPDGRRHAPACTAPDATPRPEPWWPAVT